MGTRELDVPGQLERYLSRTVAADPADNAQTGVRVRTRRKAADGTPAGAENNVTKAEAKWEVCESAFQHLIESSVSLPAALLLAERLLETTFPDILAALHPKRLEVNGLELYSAADVDKVTTEKLKVFCGNLLGKEVLPTAELRMYSYSVCGVRNGRRTMEDRHVVVPDLRLMFPHVKENQAFFAVMDGHGGQECANYVATHLLPSLLRSPHFETDLLKGLAEAVSETDGALCEKCQRQNLRSGSTLVCAFLRGEKLALAWLGDSQAGWTDPSGVLRILTEPHSPNSQEEYRRVEAAGGSVLCVQGELRVNGILNLSRSFGDVLAKPVISAEPGLVELELTGAEDLLILGCDGFWDSVETEEAAAVVKDFARSHQVTEYGALSEALVERAKANDSTDNITVLVVFLRPLTEIWKRLSSS